MTAPHNAESAAPTDPLDASSPSWCSPMEARLISSLATASALALAYGKQAAQEHRQAEAARRVVHELQEVWLWLRGCDHDFDPECARCESLAPLSDALTRFDGSDDA